MSSNQTVYPQTVYPPQGTVNQRGTMSATWTATTNPQQQTAAITLAYATGVA